VYMMRADGSEVQLVETLHYHCAMDGSRAVWRPK
jgi:TolB protein